MCQAFDQQAGRPTDGAIVQSDVRDAGQGAQIRHDGDKPGSPGGDLKGGFAHFRVFNREKGDGIGLGRVLAQRCGQRGGVESVDEETAQEGVVDPGPSYPRLHPFVQPTQIGI